MSYSIFGAGILGKLIFKYLNSKNIEAQFFKGGKEKKFYDNNPV